MQAALRALCALPTVAALAVLALPGTAVADPERRIKTFHLAAVERAHGLGEDDRRRAAQSAVARKAVVAVKGHIGAGYASGAMGPGAFDCSGLTVTSYGAAGVQLPRTSFAQYTQGSAVARDEIRPGDLVFFDSSGPGASHVAIAVSRTTVVSATSSGGVMAHPIGDSYWGGHYVGARRVA